MPLPRVSRGERKLMHKMSGFLFHIWANFETRWSAHKSENLIDRVELEHGYGPIFRERRSQNERGRKEVRQRRGVSCRKNYQRHFLRPDHDVHGSERQCMRVLEIDIFRDVSCVGACERGKLSAEKSWRHRPSNNQPGRESFMLYVEKWKCY